MIIKKIPYGLTDFERIRKEPYYYVDKTHYIEWLEESANFFFLIRPRRFGKSLFINMLRWYYDIYRRDRFKDQYRYSVPESGQHQRLRIPGNRSQYFSAQNAGSFCKSRTQIIQR